MSRVSQPQPDTEQVGDGGAPEPSGARRAPALLRLLTESTAFIFVVLLVLVLAFTVLRPEAFATVNNIRNIAVAASILLVLAVGQTYVIITAGIDLSVGSVLVFSGVVAVMVMPQVAGGQGWAAVGVGLLVALGSGLFWGLFNGILIAKANIPPLIVTLGTFGGVLGLAKVLTGGVNLRGVPRELVSTVGTGRLFGIVPWLVLIALTVALVAGVVLRLTRFGRHTYAIGSNAEAARRSGIHVDRHLIKVYAMSGLLAGLAGVMALGRFSGTTIQGHETDNLQSIAAVVIGGTSLFGGIGSVFGTVVGVLIPSVLQNGFIIIRVQPFWQEVAIGGVLIAAVYVDQLKRRTRERI